MVQEAAKVNHTGPGLRRKAAFRTSCCCEKGAWRNPGLRNHTSDGFTPPGGADLCDCCRFLSQVSGVLGLLPIASALP